MIMKLRYIAMASFIAGLGLMASQELWWFITGLADICHG